MNAYQPTYKTKLGTFGNVPKPQSVSFLVRQRNGLKATKTFRNIMKQIKNLGKSMKTKQGTPGKLPKPQSVFFSVEHRNVSKASKRVRNI